MGTKVKDEPPVCRPVTRAIVADSLQALRSMVRLPDDLDAPFWIEGDEPFPARELVPFRDRLVHLPTVEFGEGVDLDRFSVPATPRLFNRWRLAFGFDPNPCVPETWMRFLDDLFASDGEAVEMLQEWMGLCLLPDTSYQKIALLIGPPRSGKSTILKVMRGLVGEENVAAPRLASLSQTFGLEPLIHKPVALIGDAQLSRKGDSDLIVETLLAVSGEDAISVDRKFKTPWTGRLSARITIVANELPRLMNASGALVSRLLVWRLTRTFLNAEDIALDQKLAAELPAIFAWAAVGYQRLRARGRFVQARSGVGLLHEMRDLNSPVTQFAMERLEQGHEFDAEATEVFKAWGTWCEQNGRRPGDSANFGKALRAALPAVERRQKRVGTGDKRVWVYGGVRLIDEYSMDGGG